MSSQPSKKQQLLLALALDTPETLAQDTLEALAQGTPETYHNVKAIFELIKVQEKCFNDSLIISCDLKLVNITCGIQSHSSKHPCCWCGLESTNQKTSKMLFICLCTLRHSIHGTPFVAYRGKSFIQKPL